MQKAKAQKQASDKVVANQGKEKRQELKAPHAKTTSAKPTLGTTATEKDSPTAPPGHLAKAPANAAATASDPAVPGKPTTITLAVDIGGSGIKVMMLDPVGEPLGARDRIKTPKPATPEAVMAVIEKLAARQGDFDRVSVGFPGVVHQGVILTAVNLHQQWQGYNLAQILSDRLAAPVRVANDADIQGFGAIAGQGVELVATLGTGFGTALFTDGHLVPNLEIAHHRFRKGQTYEEQLGRAALKKVGVKTWNERLLKAINTLAHTFNYDQLYLGGGETRQIHIELPENVTVVSNRLGLLGGIALWR